MLVYLVSTFAFSYLLWSLSVLEYLDFIDLGENGQVIYSMTLVVGAFGPAFGSYMALRRTNQSFKSHLKRLLDFHGITLQLLALVFFLPILIHLITYAIGLVVSLPLPGSRLPSLWLYVPNLLFVTILGGGQEEIGWRGYLQEQTNEIFGSIPRASIVIGIFWGIWHLPLWFMVYDEHYLTSYPGFLIMTIFLSIIFGYIYQISANNMILVVIFHGSINAAHSLLYLVYNPSLDSGQPLSWIYIGVIVLIALIFIRYHERLEQMLGKDINHPNQTVSEANN